jgi:tetratricopeptide (TPR) repeat protein
MATKEVMVTAPLLILLYDRVFISQSWPGILRRKGYYAALAATWLILIYLMLHGGSRGNTAGFGTSISWWAYGITQFRAVAHYLRLCFWPHPLLFSYGLTLGGPIGEVIADAVLVVGLVLTSLYLAVRGSALGFLGAWFFIILSPSSTVVPISTELIAEHRVYLSLAAPLILIVCAGEFLLRRLKQKYGWRDAPLIVSSAAAVVLVTAVAVGATQARNRAYDSTLALWQNTVDRSPDDAGARNNLGNALAETGRLPEALVQFQAALQLVPGYDQPHFNLGNTLVKLGRPAEAIPHFQAALVVRPNDASFRYALGTALKKTGHPAEARQEFNSALAGTADTPLVWYFLGNAFLDDGQLPQAKLAYEAALRLRPDYPDALVDHAAVLAQLGDLRGAIDGFEAAIRLEPGAADVRNNLGGLLAENGRLQEAQQQFEAALALKPDYRQAQDNLARVKAMILAAPR